MAVGQEAPFCDISQFALYQVAFRGTAVWLVLPRLSSRGACLWLQVRTAYRAMAAIYHPDRNPAPDAAAKYMQVSRRPAG